MKTNTFKARLKDRQQIGLWVSLGNAASAEILARSGADWLLIDMEHSPNEVSTVLEQLRAVAEDCEVIVRPPEASQTVTKRLLDIGTKSIMFPMIDTAEQARQAVSWTRYPRRECVAFPGLYARQDMVVTQLLI
ncbi:2,4-dihydroxyhept-2-ene-1,7-dioic acid aldolase [Ochrobactrum pseudogrignonense]|nr:2,4-dihydroxyhept-2-ene-1,7-dioic acid aldolase [Brucella pseudogrignonensis]